MYKPPKREDPASLLKFKMPVCDGVPPASAVKVQLDECQTKKGMQIEQAWVTSKPGQKFVLIAQLQEGKNKPVWTLYEESESGSKMHWSQPFEVTDIDMMYDVICMSAPDSGRATGIPDALKPGANDKKPKGPAPARSASGIPAAAPSGNSGYPAPAAGSGYPAPAAGSGYPAPAGGSGYPTPAPAAAPAGYPAPAAPANYPAPAAAAGYPAPPAGAGYPPQQPQGAGNAYPAQGGYPPQQQQQYAAPPQQAPYPQGYPPYPGAQQAPYPSQQYPGAPPQWQQGYPNPQQGGYQGQPPGAASPNSYAPSPSYASQFEQTGGGSALADYGAVQHTSNILLGELIREAGLITEPALEAALKIQDFVREERMSPTQACEILKKHHALGAAIDNYLTPEDFDLDGKKPQPKKNAASKPAGGTTKSTTNDGKSGASSGSAPEMPRAEKIKLQLAAFDLLQKAGLLKNDDLQTAHAVYKKHGGDIVQMLTAAGKMDATTYKAAEVCVPLIHDNKMKVEQCIIALNYCQRSRVDFDSALDELGWENPRKA